MNDLDLCLEVVSRSCQPLRYIRRWISRKPLQIEAWFQRTTNRKCHMGYQMVTWPMTSRDPQRCCKAVRSAILATAWLLVLPVWQTNGRSQWQCVVSLCPSLSMFLMMIQWSVAVISRMPPRSVQFRCCSAFWWDIHMHAHSQLLCIEVQPISTEWLRLLLTQIAVHRGPTAPKEMS